ncbi:MAG: toxin-antitoxin (TA) system antitoxin [Candidatus Tectomicrobia bacterium]|uniref:Toxin-antitoxin (TA) system antitoxin n=1 Tax=Tectimicrobiota bacterium TaxID=2528274 RepID=A0A933GKF5_UNCTE|nr:toxin-antitoxin (TA) system antitoxin [Candidatus Tectomicrobia bacterium]
MQTKTIDIAKTSPDLKGLLSQVATGIEIILTEGETPIARLMPMGNRVAGLHSGTIWTSDDFDEP